MNSSYDGDPSQSDPTYSEDVKGDFVEGFDPEVAEDIGIPVDDESLVRQRVSGELVNIALSRDELLRREAEEYAELEAREGRVRCANCNDPTCDGCGRS